MDELKLHNVMGEKANAMLRYRRLLNIGKLFRLVEFFLALIFFTWVISHLPFALKTSYYYFQQIAAILVSPLFIFLLTNAIVIVVFTKSGQSSSTHKEENYLYPEFIQNGETHFSFSLNIPPPPEEIVYHDKQMISQVTTTTTITTITNTPTEDTIEMVVSDPKSYRRSKSDKFSRECSEKPSGKLRRSVTQKCPKPEETPADVVDKLSNEDFQRTIEAFIAKQVKFHKQEKLAIVLPTHTT